MNGLLNFEEAVNNFKATDLDPREIIILDKDLYDSSKDLQLRKKN